MGKKLVVTPGDKFGRWEIIREDCRGRYNERRFLCKCSCGNKRIIDLSSLNAGKTQSCGCLRKEVSRDKSTTHGLSKTRIYRIWHMMLHRCHNKDDGRYNSYGGRGIKVCDDWNDFTNFYNWSLANGYESHLTIDRIDNDGDYCPENCRWATQKEQQNNRSNNHNIEYNGKKLTCQQWAERTGIKESTIRFRLSKGWSAEQALCTPVGVKYG